MNDLCVGRIVRAVRHERGLRQLDVAKIARIDRSALSDIERGRLEDVSLRNGRRLCAAVGIDLVVDARWRGGAVDRLLDRGHAAIVESTAAALTAAGWSVELEFTFNEYGDRGSVDVLAWRGSERALLIVEVKTALTDLQAMLMAMSRKVRVVPGIVARERGWDRRALGRVLVVAGTSANRAVVRRHQTMFVATFPGTTAEVKAWLRHPGFDFAGVWFASSVAIRHTGHIGQRRVRVP